MEIVKRVSEREKWHANRLPSQLKSVEVGLYLLGDVVKLFVYLSTEEEMEFQMYNEKRR